MTAGLTGRGWLRDEPAAAETCLVLLPHAGAGAASFTRWLDLFPPSVTPVRVRLPGREHVAGEPPLRRVEDVVDGLLPQLNRLPGNGLALYGHSMGALVAFELARALCAAGTPPRHLFVSGRRAPQLVSRKAPVHRLPDAEFAAELARLGIGGGIGNAPARNSAVQRYAVRVTKADLELSEEYVFHPAPGIPCPITVFHGTEDTVVDADEAAAWRELTAADFALHTFAGDHFFHHQHRADIAARITETVG